MAVKRMIYGVLLAFLLGCTAGKDICTDSRAREELDNLLDNHVVVWARYDATTGDGYLFQAHDVWRTHNGSLTYLSRIELKAVNIDPEVQVCYENLKHREYLLILAKNPSTGEFVTSLPPVPSRKSKRQVAWEKMMQYSPEMTEMNVYATINDFSYGRYETGKLIITVNQGAVLLISCKANFKNEVQGMAWVKHGKDIHEAREVYSEHGLTVIGPFLENGSNQLLLGPASLMHNGDYRCKATDIYGNEAEYQVVVNVLDRTELPACPAEYSSYCFNGGKCQVVSQTPFEKRCECPPGYDGDRCGHEINLQPIINENELLAQQVHSLKVIVIVLGVILMTSLILGLLLVIALRRAKQTRGNGNCCRIEDASDPASTLKRAPSDASQNLLTSVTVNGIKTELNGDTSSLNIVSSDSFRASPRASPRPRLKAERS